MRTFFKFALLLSVLTALSIGAIAQPSISGAGAGGPNSVKGRAGTDNVIGGNETSRPIFLTGKVVLDSGAPLPEPVAIQRVCGPVTRRETQTDSKGNFSFMLGDTTNQFQDASENSQNRTSQSGTTISRTALSMCELRATLPGYTSTAISLAGRNLTDSGDVGTLILKKNSSGAGDSISVTSLKAPGDAKKAYDKAREAFDKKKYDDAEKHAGKAVEIYSQYAMAHDLLGRAQEQLKKHDEAAKSYRAAIAADDKFVLPYIRLAGLLANKPDWAEVLNLTEKIVQLDPVSYPFAYFLRGAAFFNTGNIAEAERAALKAVEVDRDRKFPRTELLAGTILQKKGDHSAAVPHFQNYLKMDPNCAEGPQIKTYLASVGAQVPVAPAPAGKQ